MGHLYENTRAYDQGRDARNAGSHQRDNPFSRSRDFYRWSQWDLGWCFEDNHRKDIVAAKRSRISALQDRGMSYVEAFKIAAGEYRDEQFVKAKRTES